MQVASAVVAFQAFRHRGMVVVVRVECCDGPHTRPLRKNRKERGTLRFVYGVGSSRGGPPARTWDFALSRFAFFRFAHANRKLPRSTRSGVTCPYYTPCAARLKTLTPKTTLRDSKNLTPTVPDSPQC